MSDPYSIIAVNDKEMLNQYKNDILALFELCFDQTMGVALWEWAYQQNPCGNAYVQLAYCNDALVGHYAMIPQRYCDSHQRYSLALSMTTMVHPAHRRAGIFNRLAKDCYAQAVSDGVQAVVGFPNNRSTPGFVKRLQWQCHDEYRIIKTTAIDHRESAGCEIIHTEDFLTAFRPPHDHVMLALDEHAVLDWRLSKPDNDYVLLRNKTGMLAIVKPYGSTLDVVFFDADRIIPDIQTYALQHGFTGVTLFSAGREQEPTMVSDITQYRFGYRHFRSDGPVFLPQLIMSDVF